MGSRAYRMVNAGDEILVYFSVKLLGALGARGAPEAAGSEIF